MATEARDWSYSGLRAKAGPGIVEYGLVLALIAILVIVWLHMMMDPAITNTLVETCNYPWEAHTGSPLAQTTCAL